MNEYQVDEKNMTDETPAEMSETPETVSETSVEEDEGKLKGGDKKKLRRAEAELAEVKKQLEAAEAALAEEKDRYLRMLAEYDNYRRRTAKEKEGIYTDATSDAVKAMLPVLDNLERAAAAVPETDSESAFAKGVALTLKSAKEAFAKLDVTEVETDVFNPDVHNAVMHVEDESLPEGAIVEVFQKGYRKGDHVIRYAMVKVAN